MSALRYIEVMYFAIRRAVEEFKKYWSQKGQDGNVIPFPIIKPSNDDKDDKEQK